MCTTFDFTFFINFLYNTSLAGNPLICNCANSYSWNQFMAQILNTQSVNVNTVIFQTKCTNGAFASSPVVYFPSFSCQKNSACFYATCSSSCTQQNSSQPDNGAALAAINSFTPDSEALSVYDGYIAAIILVILLVLLFLAFLVYYLNPVECNALIFSCFPPFYRFCPCTSAHKREKCYDLFISYNKADEKYVLWRIVPFLKCKSIFIFAF